VPVDIADLEARWTRVWGQRPPISYELRGRFPDRWVRFHSLPGSQRYATSEAEYREILHRHTTVLSDLADDPGRGLLAVTASWSDTPAPADRTEALTLAAPDAAYWTSVMTDDSVHSEQVWAHLWVSPASLHDSGLEQILRLAADDASGPLLIVPATMSWLYAPYDGGADVIADTSQRRDHLRASNASWLSAHPSGL
jgi:hypothetical protein